MPNSLLCSFPDIHATCCHMIVHDDIRAVVGTAHGGVMLVRCSSASASTNQPFERQWLRGASSTDSSPILAICLDTSLNRVTSVDSDGVMCCFDVETRKALCSVTGRSAAKPMPVLAGHPYGGLVATADAKTVRVWDVEDARNDLEPLQSYNDHSPSEDVTSLAFSPDGKWLASGGSQGHIVIWNVAAAAVVKTLRHSQPVHHVMFHPQDKILCCNGTSFWDLETFECVRADDASSQQARVACFTDAQHTALVAGPRRQVRRLAWDSMAISEDLCTAALPMKMNCAEETSCDWRPAVNVLGLMGTSDTLSGHDNNGDDDTTVMVMGSSATDGTLYLWNETQSSHVKTRPTVASQNECQTPPCASSADHRVSQPRRERHERSPTASTPPVVSGNHARMDDFHTPTSGCGPSSSSSTSPASSNTLGRRANKSLAALDSVGGANSPMLDHFLNQVVSPTAAVDPAADQRLIEAMMAPHDKILSVLNSRGTGVRVVQSMWMSGDSSTALHHLRSMNDDVTTAGVLRLLTARYQSHGGSSANHGNAAMHGRGGSGGHRPATQDPGLTLARCADVLALIEDLLMRTHLEQYRTDAFNALAVIIRAFGGTIKRSYKALPRQGGSADVAFECRRTQSVAAQAVLVRIFAWLRAEQTKAPSAVLSRSGGSKKRGLQSGASQQMEILTKLAPLVKR